MEFSNSNDSVDKIKCSVIANGINGGHTASVEMDLDKPHACNRSDELQVYEDWRGYAFENGKDFRDCNGFYHGQHVGTISVTAIDDPKCRRQRNDIKVIVRSFSDTKRKEICVLRDICVCEFKQKIYNELFRIVPSQQTLVYNGRTLVDNQTLAYYGIQNDAIIDLTGRLRGG